MTSSYNDCPLYERGAV